MYTKLALVVSVGPPALYRHRQFSPSYDICSLFSHSLFEYCCALVRLASLAGRSRVQRFLEFCRRRREYIQATRLGCEEAAHKTHFAYCPLRDRGAALRIADLHSLQEQLWDVGEGSGDGEEALLRLLRVPLSIVGLSSLCEAPGRMGSVFTIARAGRGCEGNRADALIVRKGQRALL